MGQLADMAAVGIHGVNIEIAVAGGSEDDSLAIAADRGFRIVSGRVSQPAQVAGVRLGRVNVVGIVDRPDVSVRVVGLGRALGIGSVSGRKKDAITGREKIAACRAPFACAHELGLGWLSIWSIDRNGVDLVAGNVTAL